MLKETESGLIVPSSALSRKRKVITNDLARTIQRGLRHLQSEGIQILMMCPECGKTNTKEAPLIPAVNDQTGELLLTCGCSVWILEGVKF